MTDTARTIYDTAPLGAIIRFSDGTPRPPERCNRKLPAWKNNNSIGRLTQKTPGRSLSVPDGFTLHEGDVGSHGVTLMRVYRGFSVSSALTLSVESVPAPGQYLVLKSFAGQDELIRVADSRDEAERALARHPYCDTRIETVGACA